MELGKVGSGLDVDVIVKALVDADVAPKTNSLNRRKRNLMPTCLRSVPGSQV